MAYENEDGVVEFDMHDGMAGIDYRALSEEQAVKIESMREALEMVKPIIEGLDLTHRSSETCEMLNAVYRAIKEESE